MSSAAASRFQPFQPGDVQTHALIYPPAYKSSNFLVLEEGAIKVQGIVFLTKYPRNAIISGSCHRYIGTSFPLVPVCTAGVSCVSQIATAADRGDALVSTQFYILPHF